MGNTCSAAHIGCDAEHTGGRDGQRANRNEQHHSDEAQLTTIKPGGAVAVNSAAPVAKMERAEQGALTPDKHWCQLQGRRTERRQTNSRGATPSRSPARLIGSQFSSTVDTVEHHDSPVMPHDHDDQCHRRGSTASRSALRAATPLLPASCRSSDDTSLASDAVVDVPSSPRVSFKSHAIVLVGTTDGALDEGHRREGCGWHVHTATPPPHCTDDVFCAVAHCASVTDDRVSQHKLSSASSTISMPIAATHHHGPSAVTALGAEPEALLLSERGLSLVPLGGGCHTKQRATSTTSKHHHGV